ncbi:Crp/Fnr family transcriptional regulator [Rhodoplanes sp. TEM]|uniref:Crp/Fnr family transcriptional regulator n=1 Tax=Rhodoplanes tepidamans TaxID=200616 RepID=A0ABT5J8K1_RHOTP|nr:MULTISPECIES: Crp/Fnr family transcriptional regulator [Rhodoplanes]MDC7785906.1 Crp/Fnr family transcriptional regulator [Rhodoplanes tepidamans]MDC7985018.1 Crp/Fnr family transcriptional regulator [Rhodoplanes sp. TEM]MDQ0355476.1 CRP/FNR family transcriptional regulator [Rhodoplanes tepidamans]
MNPRGDTWMALFPPLAGLPEAERGMLATRAAAAALPAGTTVFEPQQACGAFLFVTRGSVRVYQLDQDGNEIVLYRLGPGSICILTTMALLAADRYSAYAVTETEVEAVALPGPTFDDLMGRSPRFRGFVFLAHAERMADLMRVIQNVTFESIESRLAARLLALAADRGTLSITHQQLAAEIGSAREVVSRHLKAFERRGWVSLARNRIEVRNAASLRGAAGDADA